MKIRVSSNLAAFCLVALASVTLTACGDDSSAASSTASATGSPVGTIASTSPTTDTLSNGASVTSSTASQAAPKISGKALTSINVGAKYQFTPSASSPSGAKLAFSIANKPEWASFDTTTGTLAGTPSASNVGTYANITISATDGNGSASLAFTVAVNQMSDGSATLDWAPPTENTDGSTLSNLSAYKVYYGTSPNNLTESVKISNPGLSSYTVTNLSSGTWYFAVTAVSGSGVESSQSGVIATTI